MEKIFDLNIEQVLEHWNVEHALREIIANAIDEQILTQSKDIEIYLDNENRYHIRDYGRVIRDVHFTQNENEEKISSSNIIGKFGVGLKDALAVFFRHNIGVEIHSKYATITLKMLKKPGFNMETLHAIFNEGKKDFIGTDFVLSNITEEEINKAKDMFLIFSKKTILDKNRYGEVYFNNNNSSKIFINGVEVAIEENFMFSYNITNINTKIKKALNRERSNVGRTAYTESIKNILLNSKSEKILHSILKDLENIVKGANKDETSWIDIASYAAKEIAKNDNVIFMSPEERNNLSNQDVEILNNSDKNIIFIPNNIFDRVKNDITSFSDIKKKYYENFSYEFIDYEELNQKEKEVFDLKKEILKFMQENGYNCNVKIRVSSTILNDGYNTRGCYNSKDGIIILRKALTRKEFAGVLLHEFAHFVSGYSDNTREFENVLTEIMGKLMNKILELQI